MIQPTSYLVVPGLLIRGELEMLDALIQSVRFQSGATTATTSAKAVKHNLQAPMDDSSEKQQIDAIVLQALAHSPLVQAAMTPVKILPPVISRYEPGMHSSASLVACWSAAAAPGCPRRPSASAAAARSS